jgi:hypothetical protein
MKLNLIINKIITYKNNFFNSLEKKEINNITQRRNIQEKEKEIAKYNKTQKSFKSFRINNKMFSSLNADKNSRNNNGKFLFSGENNFLTTSYKSFGRTQTNDKNYSEKKKRMIIKEKILEKQNNELFLLDTRDLKHKNKLRKFKNILFSTQGSNQALSINTDTSKRKEPKLVKSLSKQKPNIYYFSKDFFVDKIKQALYNNSLAKNPFK